VISGRLASGIAPTSAGIPAAEAGEHGDRDDLEVERERPVLDVVVILENTPAIFSSVSVSPRQP
jgi:hypothetical protein